MKANYFYAVKAVYFCELDYEECTEYLLIYASDFSDVGKQLEAMYGDGLVSADINILEQAMNISTEMYDYLCNGEYTLEGFGD